MPYNISPETFSIIHIFGSRLSFQMPLAISHFFFHSHIYFLPFLAMVLSTFLSKLSL